MKRVCRECGAVESPETSKGPEVVIVHPVFYWDRENKTWGENDVHNPQFLCLECANTRIDEDIKKR